MPRRLLTALILAALAQGCTRSSPDRNGHPSILIFAAASLRDLAADLELEFEDRYATEVAFNFAGSNTLAQQIRAAPRVDVFLSADDLWIAFLQEAGEVAAGAQRPFLANRLVVVGHQRAAVRLTGPADLALADFRGLAIGDPEGVPAGRYARAYLERSREGLWEGLAGRIVPALDVRAALALVESDPEILGIVYRTDAMASDQVRVLWEFTPLEDLPIAYWAVAIRRGPNPKGAREFLDFLTTPEARRIAARHGFEAIDG